MRYSATEKLEIIHLVEQSPLPAHQTLAKLGIARATFYRWYDRYRGGGPEALSDRSPRPDRVWNRIPENRYASGSFNWRSTSPRCRRVSWLFASPTRKAILCQRLRSIAS